MFYVYVIESQVGAGWYIGFSLDPYQRVITHNSGGNASTKRLRPWKLIYYEAYLLKADALGRERFLKSGSGHRYLKKQLRHYLSEV